MIVLVLSAFLVLAVGGCACVVWAQRGGPRWTRAVASATLTAGELVRRSQKNQRRSSQGQTLDSGD
ncbi:hypothetical protein [Streptomyces sp. NPDC059063]|uniref:hypothetical protein n=1 Tax=unclassified Streptomyces TaxID=2593676 RepID=UPI0036A4F242